jgi:tetratricopeptide (TPR) repeat protein
MPTARHRQVFLSAVSDEFRSYRSLLAADLRRPNLDVKTQEDFGVTPGTTLEKLDEYIRHCNAVVHLIGRATGAVPPEPAVAALRTRYPDLGEKIPALADLLARPQPGISYTQWEAYLAIYHGRRVFFYRSTDDAVREPTFITDPAQERSQQEHYHRIDALGRDRGQFRNPERLSSAVLRDLVEILPPLEPSAEAPRAEAAGMRPGRGGPGPLVHFVHALLPAQDYQTRPESDRLCEWWRQGGIGLCALVGIGGAGKTALVERFLRVLPGVLPESRDLPKDPTLPTPRGVFVFSFYDAPNPDEFFARLTAWIRRRAYDEAAPHPSYQQLRSLLEDGPPTLLVLDGLEKVQDDPLEGNFGQVTDPSLRDLVGRIAAGLLPRVSAVVTTRFPIPDLDEDRPRHYHRVDIEEIPAAAALALLRRRGVRGADEQLRHVIDQCGRHALIVDLVGGYLAHFGRGDPSTPLDLGTPEQLSAAIQEEPDPRRRRVLKQEYRFARVARRYRESFGRTDPAALALLERMALFNAGVNAHTLAAVFLRRNRGDRTKDAISGPALAGLTRAGLRARLARLAEMRLLIATPGGRYAIHPAIRDGFLTGLRPESARRGHAAVRTQLFAELPEPFQADDEAITRAVLEGRPGGEVPSDPASLDLLEEIVYHTLEAGHPEDAVFHYTHRVGGYRNIGRRLAMYERGERICRKILLKAGERSRVRPVAATLRMGVLFSLIGCGMAAASLSGGIPFHWGAWLLGCLSACLATEIVWRALLARRQRSFGLTVATHIHMLNDYTLYLGMLGRACDAAAQIRQAIELTSATTEKTWRSVPVCILVAPLAPLAVALNPSPSLLHEKDRRLRGLKGNLARLYLWMGRYTSALALLTDLLASPTEDPDVIKGWLGDRDRVELMRGHVREVLARQEGERRIDLWALQLLGRFDEGIELAEHELAVATQEGSERRVHDFLHVLGTFHRCRGDLREARDLLQRVKRWALAHEDQMMLCRVGWNYAELALAEAKRHPPDSPAARERLQEARTSLDDALWIASNNGLSIHYIDLLVLRGRLAMECGDAEAALRDARVALTEGVRPPSDSDLPVLLAATDPECAYAWGEAAARHLRAEALLLQAAERHGRPEFDPDRPGMLSPDVRSLIESAHDELAASCRLEERIQDPRRREIDEVRDELRRGRLTWYPVRRPVNHPDHSGVEVPCSWQGSSAQDSGPPRRTAGDSQARRPDQRDGDLSPGKPGATSA